MVDIKCKTRLKTGIVFFAVIGICLALVIPATADSQLFKGEWRTPAGYPDGFNGYGRLDRITSEEAVIDDGLEYLSPNTAYHTPSSRYTSPSAIKVGDLVGYLKDRFGRIISLWKIPED